MNDILTSEQKKIILEEWDSREDNPPSLLELIRTAFPNNPELDGRTKEGKAVKAFLVSHSISVKASHQYVPKGDVELTEEQKEYSRNNAQSLKPYEMARILFNNNKITHLNKESIAIEKYLKSINHEYYNQQQEEVLASEYKPPKSQDRMIARINKFVKDGINRDKLTPKQKKDIESLIAYLHTYRFLYQMNNYDSEVDKDLFESSFIRYTYDKSDLTQEEVDQYLVLSIEVVIASNIQRRVEHLQRLLDDAADDTEGRRISMALVESINTAQTEYHQSVTRQQKLLNDLKEKRSDKLKSQIKENASILNLVEMWREEETRHKMIKLAELRKKVVKEEIDNLSSMDEMKARILGLSEEEALDG